MRRGWRTAAALVGVSVLMSAGCARTTPGPAVPSDGRAPTDANGVTTSVIEARNLAREAADVGGRRW